MTVGAVEQGSQAAANEPIVNLGGRALGLHHAAVFCASSGSGFYCLMLSLGRAAYPGLGGCAFVFLIAQWSTSGLVRSAWAIATSALFALDASAGGLGSPGICFILLILLLGQTLFFAAMKYRAGGPTTDVHDTPRLRTFSQFNGVIDRALRHASVPLSRSRHAGRPDVVVQRFVNSRFGNAIRGAREGDWSDPNGRSSLADRHLPDGGHDEWHGRCPARQTIWLRRSSYDGLDALGLPGRRGDDRRHGLALGALFGVSTLAALKEPTDYGSMVRPAAAGYG